MKHLKQHRHYLHIISSGEGGQIKALLKTANQKQVDIISEIASNILQKVIELSSKDKMELEPYAKFIRTIGRKGNRLSTRKKAIVKNWQCVAILIKIALKTLLKLWL